MKKRIAISCLLSVGLIPFGCRRAADRPLPGPEMTGLSVSAESAQPNLAMLRYHTGDVKKWPEYQFPLEHTFDVPEVPPGIVGPFTPEHIPNRPAED